MFKHYHITSHQVSQLSAKEIKQGFIARKNLLNRTLTKINQTNRTDSVQHYVFVGPRGSGKTLMLNRIKVEFENSDKFITVYLPEEQPGIFRLFDVWLAVINELISVGYHIQKPVMDLSKENFSYLSKTGYEIIHEFLKKENKQIILLLDNIDRVFYNIEEDKALLRELLQNHKDLIIIGGSTEMSEDFWNYGDPFYQFFKIVRLEDL
jgi:Cdc6-like AAA superfamily ATPase